MNIEKLKQLQQKHLEGKIEPSSPESEERRQLFFEHAFEDIYTSDEFGNLIPMFQNSKPCLENCKYCNKSTYMKINEEGDEEINPNGHTGWGVIGDRYAMSDNRGYHFSFCSETCWNEYREKQEASWTKLINKSYSDFPEKMDLPDFEDFTVWYANGFLRDLSEEKHNQFLQSNPLLTQPKRLAAELRRSIIPSMSDYVDILNNGYNISNSGKYTFKKPIPKSEVVKLLQQ